MATVKLWRVISPETLREADMRLELLNALRRMGTKIRQDFRKTTETWSTKVDFGPSDVSLSGGKASVEVSTDNQIYRFVNNGTQEHGIAGIGKRLAFQETYSAKTSPGVIGSNTGGKSGSYRFPDQVWHPGMEARSFDKAIAAKWRKEFRAEMDSSMAKVRLASGHER